MLSSVGTALTTFAVPLQVFEITHSSLAVGAIGVAQFVPTMTIGLAGGTLADATDRRKLVLIISCCQGAVSAALAAQAFAGARAIWLLYALVMAASAASAIRTPATRTFIPSLLPPGQVPAALALNRISFQVVITAGPALAGLITAVPGLGLRACYLLDAVSYGAAWYAASRLPARAAGPGAAGPGAGHGAAGPGAAGAPRPSARAVAEGLRYLRRNQVLAGAFLTDLNATLFGLPVALFPAINAERFHGDPRTLGLFTAAIGVGGLLSAALSGPIRHLSRQGRVMIWSAVVWGAAFAGFAIVRSLWLTLGMLALAGAADTFTVVFRGAIVQATTPDPLRGRVNAAEYIVGAGGGQLGNLESGALGSLTSPPISALAGGLVTVAGAVAIGLALPAFARYRAQPDPAPGGPRPGGAAAVTAGATASGTGLPRSTAARPPRGRPSSSRQRPGPG
jgi:MFS family permease